jgi:hypothetical protein
VCGAIVSVLQNIPIERCDCLIIAMGLSVVIATGFADPSYRCERGMPFIDTPCQPEKLWEARLAAIGAI